MLLNPGVQTRLVAETTAGSGITEVPFSVQSDGVLMTLSATAVAGTLLAEIYAIVGDNEVLVLALDSIAAPTTTLLLKATTSPTTSSLLLRTTYSAACTYEVQVRAIDSGGGGGGGGSGTTPGTASPGSEDHIVRDELLLLGELSITGTGTVAILPSSSETHLMTIPLGSLLQAE